MSGTRKPPIPDELRERLAERTPEERRDLELVWDRLGLGEPRAIEGPDVDEAWADMGSRLAPAAPPPHERRPVERPPLRHRRHVQGWAAAVTVVALVAIGLGLWHRPMVVTVPPGAIATVHLPDGSTVELNSASELTYRRGFHAWPFVDAEVRNVTLRGEGFFDVARSERPFIVETADAWVEALGTQFNVRARETAVDQETTVTLASGRVRVSLRVDAGNGTVLAEEGAYASVVHASTSDSNTSDSKLVTHKGSLAPVLAWRRRAFSAIDRSVASILAEIERHFAVDIVVEGPLALSDSMTVFYGPRVSPEDILHDLCLVQGCRFRRTSRGFAVSAEPARSRDA